MKIPLPTRLAQLLYGILLMSTHPVFSQTAHTDLPYSSWAEVQTHGKGTLKVFWYESRPFIFESEPGQMRGIEADIMEGFKKYLTTKYHYEVNILWQEATDFGDVYARISGHQRPGTFGLSAFSTTPEREQEVGFSPPYMSDITVLISSKQVPVVKTVEEFNHQFSKFKAITIPKTTYEEDIIRLRNQGGLTFPIEYIPSQQNILRTIEKQDSAFGYIDLPVYLMMFNNDPSVQVNRQNLFLMKRKGYAMIYPMGSDWEVPVREYFEDIHFKPRLQAVISKYLNIELYHLLESLAVKSDDPVVLLTKEKEIQQRDLQGKQEQIVLESRWRNFLMALVVVFSGFLLIIFKLYRKRHEQKLQIEAQGKSLALKSSQLEERNQHLVALDQEKNTLIRILAHDLRSPINHVQGLTQILLLEHSGLSEDQKSILRTISEASVRLNKMISSILDVEAFENGRVKILLEDIALADLLRTVVDSFITEAGKKNIRLSLQTDPVPLIVRGDVLFMTQIFENLLSNAIKFSGSGKTISLTVKVWHDHVRTIIEDEGPGFTAEELPLLFQKFSRLSAQPTGGEPSLGLGLSIVKNYVTLMNGKIWCESETGKGATFIVEFEKRVPEREA